MMPEHPRAGVTHDSLNLRPACRLVAVDRAFRTGGFVFLKRTPFQPELDIVPQLGALRAESFLAPMPVFAEKPDHRLDSAPLANKTAGVGGHRSNPVTPR